MIPDTAKDELIATKAGPALPEQSNMVIPCRPETIMLVLIWMLGSKKVSFHKSKVVACLVCMAYAIVLQGTAWLQNGESIPIEGLTETEISTATAKRMHAAYKRNVFDNDALYC